jgi:hypothetical protein
MCPDSCSASKEKAEHELQELFPAEFKSRQTDFGGLSLLRLGLYLFSK